MIVWLTLAFLAAAVFYIKWEPFIPPAPEEEPTPIVLNHDDFARWERGE